MNVRAHFEDRVDAWNAYHSLRTSPAIRTTLEIYQNSSLIQKLVTWLSSTYVMT